MHQVIERILLASVEQGMLQNMVRALAVLRRGSEAEDVYKRQDDNPMKLMSIAMKPLCEPPFPLERIEEMTALMGGNGCLNG